MNMTWRPSAALANLRRRAQLISKIRNFFAQRGVLEVETPALNSAGSTDLYLVNFCTQFRPAAPALAKTLYLQTSPEFYMKRLLAAGSGPIYQIAKAFRNEEAGRLHEPEFSMLEWYRPGFDHHALMDETDALLQSLLASKAAVRFSYQEIFKQILGIDPHQIAEADLIEVVKRKGLYHEAVDRSTHLQLLMSEIIEPDLSRSEVPVMVYDFPKEQAALARIRYDRVAVAERFEVYFKGIELANGFHELTDAAEQRKRFIEDNKSRVKMGLPEIAIDENLLAALAHGMPDCAGVAVGLDRLIMLALAVNSVDQVIAFARQFG